MGLCKCPKKKVTNLFCFEHKVNVCEHCLVDSHDKCIVKSYLQWLEDSDYNPVCVICDKHLQFNDIDCIRLVCYDVFHLECLNEMCCKLPDTTAPAGYECPSCSKSIIPQSNEGGPLIDSLKSKLAKSNWFQRSMPDRVSDDNDVDNFELIERNPSDGGELKSNDNQTTKVLLSATEKESDVQESRTTKLARAPPVHHSHEVKSHTTDHTVYQMPDLEDPSANIRKSATGYRPPNPASSTLSDKQRLLEDDNKYSRKPLLTHLSTLIKAHFPYSTSKRSPQKAYYYFMLTLVLGLVVFVLLLWFFSILGRYSADNDPMLDPRYNPNLYFGKEAKDNSIVRGGVAGLAEVGAGAPGGNIESPKIR